MLQIEASIGRVLCPAVRVDYNRLLTNVKNIRLTVVH